jgi:hypothetical protein
MNNLIMAIYDYNGTQAGWPYRTSDDTDHPVSFALVYYQQASRRWCRLPGWWAGAV